MSTTRRKQDNKIKPQAKQLLVKAWGETNLEIRSNTLVSAWRTDPSNAELAQMVAFELSDLKMQTAAIDLLQEFLQSGPLTKEILLVAGKIAFEIEAFEAAVKLYQQVVGMDPADAQIYELLVGAMGQAGLFEDAVALLQELLPVFPENAYLWLSLGEIIDLRDGTTGDAKAFYEQAYELAPNDMRVLLSYAKALEANTEAGPIYEAALLLEPNNVEANLGLAICEFSKGNLEKAWRHYEYRLDPGRKADEVAHYQVKAPTWKGEPLAGKKILLMAEQGIGDEVFFAAGFQSLIDECEQLYIGCEPRLVSVFERSFPSAIVGGFEDQIAGGKRMRSFPSLANHLKSDRVKLDYVCTFGTACGHRWKSFGDLPKIRSGFLSADPALSRDFAQRCDVSQSGNLRVGLSWESGKLSNGREHSYPGLEGMLPLLKQPNIDFFVLQYAYEKEIIDQFCMEHNVSLHCFEDIDLKADIEANLAIMEQMDLIVGPPIATQSFAKALGKRVFIVCDGLPWTAFGSKDGSLPIFEKAVAFTKIASAWAPAYDHIRAKLTDFPGKTKLEEYQPVQNIKQLPTFWVKELDGAFRGKALQKPVPPHRQQILNTYFKKLPGLKIGFCWDTDFFASEEGRSSEAFISLIDKLSGQKAEMVCLHANVTSANAQSFFDPPENIHYFENFMMVDQFSYIKQVFEKLDIIIGPASFITLASTLSGHKTVVLDDEAGWDWQNDTCCDPTNNDVAIAVDFRQAHQKSAIDDIASLLLSANV